MGTVSQNESTGANLTSWGKKLYAKLDVHSVRELCACLNEAIV